MRYVSRKCLFKGPYRMLSELSPSISFSSSNCELKLTDYFPYNVWDIYFYKAWSYQSYFSSKFPWIRSLELIRIRLKSSKYIIYFAWNIHIFTILYTMWWRNLYGIWYVYEKLDKDFANETADTDGTGSVNYNVESAPAVEWRLIDNIKSHLRVFVCVCVCEGVFVCKGMCVGVEAIVVQG